MKLTRFLSHNPFLFFSLCFFLSLLYLWPGSMTDDSVVTYTTAYALDWRRDLGPLFQMSWWAFDQILRGPGGMLIVQMLLFWSAAYLWAQPFLKSKWFWWYGCVFFWPSLWVSMGYIWKDLYFVFSYLVVGGYCSYLAYNKKALGMKEFIGLWALLVWGTSIKYQAQFVLFFPLFWMVSLIQVRGICAKKLWVKLVLAICLTAITLGTIELIHDGLIPSEKELHKWQSVKIYDLAGISVYAQKNVVPSFLFKEPQVTLSQIQNKYSHLWEPLIVDSDSPLRFTQTPQEREALMASWKKMVVSHFGAYLTHRGRVLYKTLSGTDVKYPLRHFLKAHHLPTWPANLGVLFSYLLGLPLSIFYVFLAWRNRRVWAAGPLLYLNGMALVYASFLFVFSLASTSRYVYFCVACLAFSHPLAYVCWTERKKNRESLAASMREIVVV